ncbi:MAG: citramalate synthase, partial [Armatimonadetes bacterium]|nr:citramalate synthase [Armatimonadota bacterium]
MTSAQQSDCFPEKSGLPDKVAVYDTTLRDGCQAEGISFSVEDKLHLAQLLDDWGVAYIEGGWPNETAPRDREFFDRARSLNLKDARLVAFGSTRRAGLRAEDDANLQYLAASGAPAVAIFGKSWALHVDVVLRTTRDENLRMIEESVRFLKSRGLEVVFDAEHFFDGYKDDPDYALRTLEVAADAGADWLCLCDTNGGSLPHEVFDITALVATQFSVPLGIHCHNDAGLAVANTLMAVRAGACMVQGTINGYGERAGNADLCAVIPTLQLKLGVRAMPGQALAQLVHVSRFVSELANLPHDHRA